MNANTDNTPPQAEATKGTAGGKKKKERLMNLIPGPKFIWLEKHCY